MGLGSLFKSSSSSKSSTQTNYNDSSTDITNASSIGSASSDNRVLGAGAVYTEQGITGENLKQLTNTVKTLNSDNLTTVKKLNSDALTATQKLGNQAFQLAESLYNKSENTLSSVFDKTVSAVQGSASKAIETTAQAYAESDDELRRAIDGIRPIAMYVMFAAITYFIFRNKRW